MRALIIGPHEEIAIAQIRQRAMASPIPLDDLRAAVNIKGVPLRRWKQRLSAFTVDLPIGYVVTYTREYQPAGLCHHLSVSVDTAGSLAHPEAVGMICEAFQMHEVAVMLRDLPAKGRHQDPPAEDQIVGVWPEEYASGRVAINIVALVRKTLH